MRQQIVIIGGNAAGMTAASRAKRLAPELSVTILEASQFISYSICGVPYLVAGVVPQQHQLITFTPEKLREERGIEARTGAFVEEILPARRALRCRDIASDSIYELGYDQVVLCTGYTPRKTAIAGSDLAGVYTVSRLEDGLRIQQEVASGRVRRAAVIGGGYIGLMMAHALGHSGIEVLLLDRSRRLFSQVDQPISERIQNELQNHNVSLYLGTEVKELLGQPRVEAVAWQKDRLPVDMVLIDIGVRPNTWLAQQSGIPLGMSGAIEVDSRGQTQRSGIWAAGNCAETRHLVSGRPLFSTLGTTAAKQGRVVGENLSGKRTLFAGVLETSVEKIFDLSVGRTGLTVAQAIRHGFEASSVHVQTNDRAGYYPGSGQLDVVLVFEKKTGRVLGGQIAGADQAAKRIDTLVAAVTARMSLEQLAQLDLAYAPPVATLWDPWQIAANVALRGF